VGRAITFHYQAGFAAVEVGDITAELMLAPEFEAPAAVDCEVVARAGSRPASVVLSIRAPVLSMLPIDSHPDSAWLISFL